MAAKYRRISRTVFLSLNILVAVTFLLACLAPMLNPVKWWFISMLGLGFAFIIITLLAFILFWLVFKPLYIFISIIPMIIGWKSISVFFAFNPTTSKFNYYKDPQTLRVVHWNVARFVEWKRNNNKGSQARLKMMDVLKQQNADLICLQEFFTSTDSIYYNNLDHIVKNLGYPYYYFAWTDDGYKQWFGNIIFSRYPIIDSGKTYFQGKYPETLLHVSIKLNNDTVRIYTSHLQSLHFQKQDFQKIEEIKDDQKDIVENSKGIFGKIRNGLASRAYQANMVKKVFANEHYPFVFTGDFNDVPNSYAYFTIKDDLLTDAFLEKGFGVGRTYNAISPTLRIDFVFTTKQFEIKQFNRVVKNLSDHYMLVTDVQLKKDTAQLRHPGVNIDSAR
jgi:endonuclease/exonuclease/phosphatase family metal-dependent hydrolase